MMIGRCRGTGMVKTMVIDEYLGRCLDSVSDKCAFL